MYFILYSIQGDYKMSNETTVTQVKNINRLIWRKFRAKSIMNGFDSSNECLNRLIELFAKDEINAVKK
tara:strand:- start:314 stop:517 length:204 start_codon:yes stop_codon:yes gene_type:complete